MQVLTFLLHLAGAVFLLLFAVRMVRTGIERAFGPSLQRAVTAGQNLPTMVLTGVFMAIILQSSAAVALLVAGFAGAGGIGFLPGLAVVLGGDLGSAVLILFLSQNLELLLPILLIVGGALFLKAEQRNFKQAGRILLGIALILISLQYLREAVEPIRDSNILPALSSYFQRDYVTAFLAGAALAFLMHSSVAVILMCVAVVGMGALPFAVGISLVLGANLGSAVIPVWLTRGMDPAIRRIPAANLLLRGITAILALLAVNEIGVPTWLTDLPDGFALIVAHISFNACVLLTLALGPLLEGPLTRFFPDRAAVETPKPLQRSHLDKAMLETPVRALACLRREVIRMADVLSGMLEPVLPLYADYDPDKARWIIKEDDIINKALDDIRVFAAAMPQDRMNKEEMRELRALVDYAIALEAAGDVIVKRLVPLAREKSEKRLRFSKAGRDELTHLHERLSRNLRTATSVLVSNDVVGARLLLEEKAEMARLERKSRKAHLQRLSAGDKHSFGSSDIHIETAYSLKEMHSWVVTVAHPILVREGQLLETRLIRDMSAE